MSELMANLAHSTIVGIDILEWENLIKVCSLMYAKQHAFDNVEWDNLVKFCSLILARRHAFDIFEWYTLSCHQRRSIFLYSLFVKYIGSVSCESLRCIIIDCFECSL